MSATKDWHKHPVERSAENAVKLCTRHTNEAEENKSEEILIFFVGICLTRESDLYRKKIDAVSMRKKLCTADRYWCNICTIDDGEMNRTDMGDFQFSQCLSVFGLCIFNDDSHTHANTYISPSKYCLKPVHFNDAQMPYRLLYTIVENFSACLRNNIH